MKSSLIRALERAHVPVAQIRTLNEVSNVTANYNGVLVTTSRLLALCRYLFPLATLAVESDAPTAVLAAHEDGRPWLRGYCIGIAPTVGEHQRIAYERMSTLAPSGVEILAIAASDAASVVVVPDLLIVCTGDERAENFVRSAKMHEAWKGVRRLYLPIVSGDRFRAQFPLTQLSQTLQVECLELANVLATAVHEGISVLVASAPQRARTARLLQRVQVEVSITVDQLDDALVVQWTGNSVALPTPRAISLTSQPAPRPLHGADRSGPHAVDHGAMPSDMLSAESTTIHHQNWRDLSGVAVDKSVRGNPVRGKPVGEAQRQAFSENLMHDTGEWSVFADSSACLAAEPSRVGGYRAANVADSLLHAAESVRRFQGPSKAGRAHVAEDKPFEKNLKRTSATTSSHRSGTAIRVVEPPAPARAEAPSNLHHRRRSIGRS